MSATRTLRSRQICATACKRSQLYHEPTYWADIQIPLAEPDQLAQWSPKLAIAIEARLAGRWGFAHLVDGQLRASFAVDGITDESKLMLADFARAVAFVFDVDLDVSEASASITAQGALSTRPLPGGSAEA